MEFWVKMGNVSSLFVPYNPTSASHGWCYQKGQSLVQNRSYQLWKATVKQRTPSSQVLGWGLTQKLRMLDLNSCVCWSAARPEAAILLTEYKLEPACASWRKIEKADCHWDFLWLNLASTLSYQTDQNVWHGPFWSFLTVTVPRSCLFFSASSCLTPSMIECLYSFLQNHEVQCLSRCKMFLS